MSYVYVTRDKYNKYVLMMEELDMVNELKEEMKRIFQESLEYDPEKSTYNVDKYKESKAKMLERTNGEKAFSESHLRASKKYNERNREDINRKARERYRRKKEIENAKHVELTAFA